MLLQLVKKDFKRMIRDYKALMIIILMPAVLMAVLGFSIGGLFGQDSNFLPVSVAVVDKDDREQGAGEIEEFFQNPTIARNISENTKEELIKTLRELDLKKILYQDVLGSEKVKKVIRYRPMAEQDAMKLLESGKLSAVVVIPESFTYDMLLSLFTPFKNNTAIEVIKNPDAQFQSDIAQSIVEAYTDTLSAMVIAKDSYLEAAILTGAGGIESYKGVESLANKLYGAGLRNFNIEYAAEPGKKAVSGFQYYSAGMATMFILFTAAFGGHFLVDEKKKFTYHRMMLAGITRNQMLISRWISTALITVVQLIMLMLLSQLMFHAGWGRPTDFGIFTLFVAFAAGGLSVMLSAMNLRSDSEKFSEMMNMGVSQVLAFLGGSMFPISGIPFLETMSKLVPNGAALSGYLSLMKGYTLVEVAGDVLMLSAMGLLFGAIGFAMARGGAER